MQMTDCLIAGNAGYDFANGGGMSCHESSPALHGCSITDNWAMWSASAVQCEKSDPLLVNCLICGNSIQERGGAGFAADLGCHANLINCTITGNRGGAYGGGVHCWEDGSPTLTNCIVWGNSPESDCGNLARCLTDDEGNYRFVTIKPGSYPWGNHENAWRPNHIHFSVFGRAFTRRLVTQMYFPGDPLFEFDPIFHSVRDPSARELLVATFDLGITQPEWALGYRWDIVLGRGGTGTTPLEA